MAGPPKAAGSDQPGSSEPSDIFSVRRARDSLIPKLETVPETPEEKRRRRLVRITTVVTAAVLLAITVVALLWIRHAAVLEDAVLAADDDGRSASLDEAIALLEDEGGTAADGLRARLLAVAVLEHRRPEPPELAALLASLAEGGEEPVSAKIARTYLALVHGSPSEAVAAAGTYVPAGDYAAEATHAQALAALGVGELHQALDRAQLAVREREGAPRHVALLGLILARVNGPEEGLAALVGDSPAVRIARARVLFEVHARREDAVAEARAVLDAPDAIDAEKGWAHLLLAVAAIDDYALTQATEHIGQAKELRPVADESFVLLLVPALIELGSVDDAAEEFGRLPGDFSISAGWRFQVAAELALARGDATRAEAALRDASEDAGTALLHGRLAELRGQHDDARRRYAEAARDERYRKEASTRVAAMELGLGRVDEALAALEPVFAEARNDPQGIRIAVSAWIAKSNPARAMRLVQGGLRQRPADPRLLAAKADVEMATEQWQAAVETLRAAIEHEPRVAELQAKLGDAEWKVGRPNEARDAYERARALAPQNPMALVGLLRLAVEARDVAAAREALERVDEARISTSEVDRARAQFLMLDGAGAGGVITVRRAILQRNAQDPLMWLALGDLNVQAELYGAAAGAYNRALEYAPGDTRALLGLTLVQIRTRRTAPAVRSLEDAVRAASDPSPELQVEIGYVRAALRLGEGRNAVARSLAEEVLRADPHYGPAHLILADVAAEMNRDATVHLRAAVAGRPVPPDAVGGLAVTLGPTPEGCTLARRFRAASPRGRYGPRVAELIARCR